MNYAETTPSYNQRRYGKPWIAKLTFDAGKAEYQFGSWLGTPGQEGELSIEVEPGDVIATGQKDNRKGRGGPEHIGVVQVDGAVHWSENGKFFTLAKARDAGKRLKSELIHSVSVLEFVEQ